MSKSTPKKQRSKHKKERASKVCDDDEDGGNTLRKTEKKHPCLRLFSCYTRIVHYQTLFSIVVLCLASLFVIKYFMLPTLAGVNAVISVFSMITGGDGEIGGGGGGGNNSGKTSMLTSHFLSALAEISTTIPRFSELALAPDRYAQHTMRRRQIDMIEKLAFTSGMIAPIDGDVARQVLGIKTQMQTIHQKTSDSEDGFKDAIAKIDATTAFILKQLPILNIYLQEGRICTSLTHLAMIIKAISELILQLDESTAPVASLRHDVTRMVSDIGVMESHLHYMYHKTSVGLVAHDKHSEAYRSASWFTTMARPDQQKYESLVLLHRNLDDMQLATQFLDTTFERSELQITVALNHLRSTNRRLTDIYVEMGHSSDQIERYKLELQEMNGGGGGEGTVFSECDEKIHFDETQLTRMKKLGEETVRKIETIRQQNDPILSAISVYGYGAIGDSKSV